MKHFISIITTPYRGLCDKHALGYKDGGLICSEFAKYYFRMPVERVKHFKVSLSTQPFKDSKEIKLASLGKECLGWVDKNKGGIPRYIYANLQDVLCKIGATKRVFVKIEKALDNPA